MLRFFFFFFVVVSIVLLYLMSFIVVFHENEVYARFLWQICSALKITGMCFMKTKFTHGFCQIFVKDFLFSTRKGVIFIFLLFGMFCCGFSRKRSLRTVFVADLNCSENHWNVFHEDEVYARFLSNIC